MITSHPDSHILVGVDGSAAAMRAVGWAAAEADRRSMPLMIANISDVVGFGEVPAVTVAEGIGIFSRLDAEGREALAAAKQHVVDHHPAVRVTTVQKSGGPVPKMVELSRDAFLTVVGASGVGGFGSMLLGSVAMALVTAGHSPVVVIRGDESHDGLVPRTGPVVLGVDTSASSEEAIAWAFDEASRRETGLIAVHAWMAYVDVYARLYGVPPVDEIDAQVQAEEAAFAERLAGWREKYPDVTVTALLRSGKPAKTLLEYADDAQLVVVGSRGHGDITGVLFGSVSRSLIHKAPCPVLVARTKG